MGTLPDGSAVRFTLLDAYPPPPQMNNKEGQTPCLMASYLYTPCYGTNGTSRFLYGHSDPHMPTIFFYIGAGSNIAALQSGFVYTGATSAATGTNCVCSTVTFSVLAACAVCQGMGLAIDA